MEHGCQLCLLEQKVPLHLLVPLGATCGWFMGGDPSPEQVKQYQQVPLAHGAETD